MQNEHEDTGIGNLVFLLNTLYPATRNIDGEKGRKGTIALRRKCATVCSEPMTEVKLRVILCTSMIKYPPQKPIMLHNSHFRNHF
jgi:hypothetical protein